MKKYRFEIGLILVYLSGIYPCWILFTREFPDVGAFNWFIGATLSWAGFIFLTICHLILIVSQ